MTRTDDGRAYVEQDDVTQPGASRDVSRRSVLRGAAMGGAALPLLAACGGGSSGSSSSDGSGGSGASGGSGGSGAKVAESDVPVGGGKILASEKVVVTQPAKGEFKAFSAICTHQGCTVNMIENGQIVCPCHGSHYSIKNGSPLSGPAPSPLAAKKLSVKAGEITVT